jgi:hypothetical protein
MSVLDLARRDLAERCSAFAEADDWDEHSILSPLAGVADHVCRIGDHRESAHYRASKAGPLLASAICVQRETLLGFAGGPLHEWHKGVIVAAFDVLEEVRQAVTAAAWAVARPTAGFGGLLYESDVRELRDAARRFTCWTEELAPTALPDPSEEV